MTNTKLTCELCGDEISGEPVVKEVEGQPHNFCCVGCARTYQNAHDQKMVAEVQPVQGKKRPKFSAQSGETAYFSVGGMWCAGCASAAENVLRHQAGIEEVDISFAAERGRLKFDPNMVNIDEALQRLDRLGYQARILSDESENKRERQQERMLLQLITALAFSMQVMFFYLERLYPLYQTGQISTPEIRNIQYLVWGLATPVLFIGGFSILKGAWRSLLAGTATMDTLVALGTLSAYFYSAYRALTLSGDTYFDSVAMITTFIMIGRYLESVGGNQARKDIRHLISLQPKKARVKADGHWNEVKISSLSINDVVLIKPGERIPVDGEIVDGEASINESVLTGESKPIEKNTRDKVYAGTLVADNAIQVSVTKLPSGSRLAEITRLVEQTLSEKPPIQRLADRASKYFAYGILIVTLLTGVGWIAAGAPVSSAILHAVAVLVVACPCALGLATPLALTITLGKTSKEGILIRNPTALESSGKIDRMIFDKTGTLTQGKMSVNHVELSSFCEMDEKEFLCVIASVEQYSEHPIAKTITNICKDGLQKAHNFQVERGKGVSAHVMGKLHAVVKVGSQQFFGEQEQSDLHQKALYYSKKGDVVVWVGWNHQIQGFIALGDAVNQQAKSIVQALQEMGVVITVLSGDSQETTQVISEDIGIKEFEGSCLPEQKAEYIKKWQEEDQIVAMVGDGVNDAPALAQSDLSITVAGGTDVAGETSDVVLMRSDLTLVPWLIRTSRQTRRIILENLGWAFAYNLISVPLASFGLISPVIAAIAMASSSLLVVGNSLRLRK